MSVAVKNRLPYEYDYGFTILPRDILCVRIEDILVGSSTGPWDALHQYRPRHTGHQRVFLGRRVEDHLCGSRSVINASKRAGG